MLDTDCGALTVDAGPIAGPNEGTNADLDPLVVVDCRRVGATGGGLRKSKTS